MKTFALTADDELEIPIRIIDGIEAYTQRLRNRLRIVRGEWFLDQRVGVPLLEQILGMSFDMRVAAIRSLLRDIINQTPETEAVLDMDLDFDPDTRIAYVKNLHVKWGGVVRNFQSEVFIVQIGA